MNETKKSTCDPAFQRSSTEAQQRTLDNANSMGPYSRQPPAPPVTCEQFGALKVPALVITGENSRAIFRYGSERLLGCLPKGTPHTNIPKGRHNWFSEQDDAGAKAVLSFLMQQKISREDHRLVREVTDTGGGPAYIVWRRVK